MKNKPFIFFLQITNAQSGTYQCFVGNQAIIEYSINVDDGKQKKSNNLKYFQILADCARPRTIEQFRSVQREWCKKYDNYKSNLLKWQNWYENNNVRFFLSFLKQKKNNLKNFVVFLE